MFLFIFESIGTSELMLIGVIALIFLGPRKMPEMARKIGKIMSEFRGTANEFKETWQREVDFSEEAKSLDLNALEAEPVARVESIPTVPAAEITEGTAIEAPAIKEVDASAFEHLRPAEGETQTAIDAAADVPDENDKQNWL